MLPTGKLIERLVIVTLSPLAGLALARMARGFQGAERTSSPWMAAGALGVAIVSVSFAPSGHAPFGAAISFGLGLSLLTLIAVDVTALRLPDLITLPLCGVGLGLGGLGLGGLGLGGLAPASLLDRIIGASLGFGAMIVVNAIYVRWRKREGLGLGDAKLFAAAGAWLGASALASVLLLACAGGMVWVAVRLSTRGRPALQERLPFGLPLCCAFWVVWLQG